MDEESNKMGGSGRMDEERNRAQQGTGFGLGFGQKPQARPRGYGYGQNSQQQGNSNAYNRGGQRPQQAQGTTQGVVASQGTSSQDVSARRAELDQKINELQNTIDTDYGMARTKKMVMRRELNKLRA